MTQYGCDKEEALDLWKSLEKKWKAMCKKSGKEFIDLDPNPPVVARKGKKSSRELSIQEQFNLHFGIGK
jgi:hypothetical protein